MRMAGQANATLAEYFAVATTGGSEYRMKGRDARVLSSPSNLPRLLGALLGPWRLGRF
jgi:hypothetical protein